VRGWVVFLIWVVSLVLVTAAGLAANNPPVPHQDPWPLPPIEQSLNLSLTPKELSCNASIRPGTYQANEPLQLQVTAHNPAWYIQLHATSLKGTDEEIGSEDIYAVIKQGAVALEQPQVVIQDGDLGETTIDVLIEVRTTKRYKPGTYAGRLFVIAGYPQGPAPQVITIPFELEVSCSMSGSIRGNKMYFHYGLPGESLSATAEGEILADTDVCLRLTATDGRIDSLPMLRSVSTKNRRDDCFIPLVWELRENGIGWRGPDNSSFNGGEISWQMAAGSEKIFYEIKCSPQRKAEQAAGEYGMHVVLTVTPVL